MELSNQVIIVTIWVWLGRAFGHTRWIQMDFIEWFQSNWIGFGWVRHQILPHLLLTTAGKPSTWFPAGRLRKQIGMSFAGEGLGHTHHWWCLCLVWKSQVSSQGSAARSGRARCLHRGRRQGLAEPGVFTRVGGKFWQNFTRIGGRVWRSQPIKTN